MNQRTSSPFVILLFASICFFSSGAFVRSLFAQSTNTQEERIHVVQSGETLSQIAVRYQVALDELMTLNGISEANAIYVGQTLLLPEKASSDEQVQTHTVQPGETLGGIAEVYQVPLARLMLYNGIRNPNNVRLGQELLIPPPDAPAASVPDTSSTDAAIENAGVTGNPATEAKIKPIQSPRSRPFSLIASLNPTYIVRGNDSLSQIALRKGVDYETLRRLNQIPIDSIDQLAVGRELILPATGEELQARRPAQEYVVQPTDTLGKIAQQFGLPLIDLLNANRLTSPNVLSVGQRLIIPGKTIENTQDPPAVGPQRSGFYHYTVNQGDTLSELAQVFNSTKLAILEYNDLPNEETIYAGLEIRIPYGPPFRPARLPPVPSSGSSFLVSLSRQQCWVFQGSQVRYAWTCSTGYGDWITRTGVFAVQSKIENAKSSAYQLDMPYWLGIYDVGNSENGIHGLPVDWKTGKKIWTTFVGEPATFGCAMLDDPNAAILFDLAYIGMPVYIVH